MAFLPRPVTRMMLSTPEATASSTPYWMIGLSTSGNISLGCAFVAGRKRVPRPAAGKIAFRTRVFTAANRITGERGETCGTLNRTRMLDLIFLRDRLDDARR